jgi:hypothetical protein
LIDCVINMLTMKSLTEGIHVWDKLLVQFIVFLSQIIHFLIALFLLFFLKLRSLSLFGILLLLILCVFFRFRFFFYSSFYWSKNVIFSLSLDWFLLDLFLSLNWFLFDILLSLDWFLLDLFLSFSELWKLLYCNCLLCRINIIFLHLLDHSVLIKVHEVILLLPLVLMTKPLDDVIRLLLLLLLDLFLLLMLLDLDFGKIDLIHLKLIKVSNSLWVLIFVFSSELPQIHGCLDLRFSIKLTRQLHILHLV